MLRTSKSAATRIVIVALALSSVFVVDVVALAANDDSIGSATAITTVVTGTRDNNADAIATGDAVFHDEVIVTDASGVGQFQFRDDTKLAVGPNSSVKLDDFVYDSKTSAGRVVIALTAGTMRFVTGNANHDAYEIVTPTATIGVRGTAFDLATTESGELAVAMINGAIDVCPRGRACFRHSVIGKFLHMSSEGIFSLRDHWDDAFLGGRTFAAAMPFLTDQDGLLPALRGEAGTIARYVTATGDVIKKPLLQLPKLKLPKLFK